MSYLNLDFDSGINILYGKTLRETNILEAIYLVELQNPIEEVRIGKLFVLTKMKLI